MEQWHIMMHKKKNRIRHTIRCDSPDTATGFKTLESALSNEAYQALTRPSKLLSKLIQELEKLPSPISTPGADHPEATIGKNNHDGMRKSVVTFIKS